MVTTAISIKKYLNGPIPDPDVEYVEYVDGELKGKELGTVDSWTAADHHRQLV